MSENSGWIKYAVVGVIVLIAIIAALVLLGVADISNLGKGGGGGGGTGGGTRGGTGGGTDFGAIGGIVFVLLLIPVLIGILKWKRKEPEVQPEGKVEFRINPPEATFEFDRPRAKKVGFGVYNRGKEDIRNVQLASYPSLDHQINNTPSSQFINIPKNSHAEGYFEVESTIPDKKWAEKERTVKTFATYLDSKGQKFSTNFQDLDLKWEAKRGEEAALDLRIQPNSRILKDGSPTATFDYIITNNGIDDVKNCILVVAPSIRDLVEIEDDGYFKISLIEGGGKDVRGSFKVKPAHSLDSLTEEKAVDLIAAVFKSENSSEKISDEVVKSVVLIPKSIKEEKTDIELEVADPIVRFLKKDEEVSVQFTIRNRGGKKADCSLGIFQRKGEEVCGPNPTFVEIGTLAEKKSVVCTALLKATKEDWKGEHPLLAVIVVETDSGRVIASNRVQLRAVWGPEAEGKLELYVAEHSVVFEDGKPEPVLNYTVINNSKVATGPGAFLAVEVADIKLRNEIEFDYPAGIFPVGAVSPNGGQKPVTVKVKSKLAKSEWPKVGTTLLRAAVLPAGGAVAPITNSVKTPVFWKVMIEEKAEIGLEIEDSVVEFSPETKTVDIIYTVTNNGNKEATGCELTVAIIPPGVCQVLNRNALNIGTLAPGERKTQTFTLELLKPKWEHTQKIRTSVKYKTGILPKESAPVWLGAIWTEQPEKKISISGRVIIEGTTDGIENAVVTAYKAIGTPLKKAATDADGYYTISIGEKELSGLPKIDLFFSGTAARFLDSAPYGKGTYELGRNYHVTVELKPIPPLPGRLAELSLDKHSLVFEKNNLARDIFFTVTNNTGKDIPEGRVKIAFSQNTPIVASEEFIGVPVVRSTPSNNTYSGKFSLKSTIEPDSDDWKGQIGEVKVDFIYPGVPKINTETVTVIWKAMIPPPPPPPQRPEIKIELIRPETPLLKFSKNERTHVVELKISNPSKAIANNCKLWASQKTPAAFHISPVPIDIGDMQPGSSIIRTFEVATTVDDTGWEGEKSLYTSVFFDIDEKKGRSTAIHLVAQWVPPEPTVDTTLELRIKPVALNFGRERKPMPLEFIVENTGDANAENCELIIEQKQPAVCEIKPYNPLSIGTIKAKDPVHGELKAVAIQKGWEGKHPLLAKVIFNVGGKTKDSNLVDLEAQWTKEESGDIYIQGYVKVQKGASILEPPARLTSQSKVLASVFAYTLDGERVAAVDTTPRGEYNLTIPAEKLSGESTETIVLVAWGVPEKYRQVQESQKTSDFEINKEHKGIDLVIRLGPTSYERRTMSRTLHLPPGYAHLFEDYEMAEKSFNGEAEKYRKKLNDIIAPLDLNLVVDKVKREVIQNEDGLTILWDFDTANFASADDAYKFLEWVVKEIHSVGRHTLLIEATKKELKEELFEKETVKRMIGDGLVCIVKKKRSR
ncbi:TPA: carboxypeptidase regulatory-like domain-containing protein [archaeon]|nr:carboxypeptidase regulatory-like domain-containing protein [Candidatus Naiadarchaeales archaeon SRR2090159.bin1288]